METNKLILACLITLCSLPVAAQVKLGIGAGANLSNYITDSHSNPSDSKNMKVGFQAGLTVDYEFQNHLMLMSGLFFVRKGGNLKLGENYYGKDGINAYYRYPDVEVKMNYLQIPVKLGYNFHINDKISLIPNVGLYAAYGFNAGESDLQMVGDGKLIHAGWKPLDGYGNTSDQAIRGFNHWDVGATAGIKAVIGKHYTISFDYNIGLNKAQSTYGLRNSTFQLSVGYRF